jgi:hypothetical protein
MANLTSIQVANNRPDSVDLILNGTTYTLNAYQVSQLNAVMQRVAVQCQNSIPSHTGATVSLPAGMAS